MKHRILLGVLGAVAVLSTMPAAQQGRVFTPLTDETLRRPSPDDWLAWRGTTMSQGYSALDQINRGNVKQLQLAWAWAMEPGAQEPAPIVYDGVMYLPSPGGIVQALDGETGDLIWEYRHQYADGRRHTEAVRGLSIYDDKVFLNAPDARIVALDARTGKVVWNVQVADPAKGFTFGAASIVARGKVISGLNGCSNFVEEKCAVTAHDAKTGRELWRTPTIPKPDDPAGRSWGDVPFLYRVGTGMWITGSYDPELNLVYWSTSQAKPWHRAARGTDGDALYSSSVLALDPDTGKIVWFRQLLPGETNDLDEVFESVLVDVGARKSLFKIGKIGILWEIDRRTGQMLRATDLGYQNVVDVDPASGKVTYRPGRIPKLNEPFDLCPSHAGVRNWPSTAYSPETHGLYVPIQLNCATQTYLDVEKVPGANANAIGRRVDRFHPKAEGFLGELLAISTSGEVLWKKRQRAPFSTAALTTAGGLVFIGDLDRYLRAYDVRSGEVLWQTRAQTSGEGFPLSYAVRGRQYVAIPVGVGAVASGLTTIPAALAPEIKRPNAGNAIMVFALPR